MLQKTAVATTTTLFQAIATAAVFFFVVLNSACMLARCYVVFMFSERRMAIGL